MSACPSLPLDTDYFIDMSATARLFYYELAIRGDDDGFVASPKKIMKMVGCSEDDFKLLTAKQFIIPFESGVVVIRHWKAHNAIRSDRYKSTIHQEEKSLLAEDKSGVYVTANPVEILSDNQLTTNPQPSGCISRIGEVNKVNKINNMPESETDSESLPEKQKSKLEISFDEFWESYPKKKSRGKAEKVWKSIKPNKELVAMMIEKLAQAKICSDWKKDNGQFIPYPASWLNAKMWEDDYGTIKMTVRNYSDPDNFVEEG